MSPALTFLLRALSWPLRVAGRIALALLGVIALFAAYGMWSHGERAEALILLMVAGFAWTGREYLS